MASFSKFESFVEAVAEKAHNLGSDQLKVALCTNANAPIASDSILGDLTEINYANLSAREITTVSSVQSGGTYKLTLTDLVLTASGAVATFRHIVIYNDTAGSDELVAYFDYGSDITLADGDTFTLDFDASNGFLTIA